VYNFIFPDSVKFSVKSVKSLKSAIQTKCQHQNCTPVKKQNVPDSSVVYNFLCDFVPQWPIPETPQLQKLPTVNCPTLLRFHHPFQVLRHLPAEYFGAIAPEVHMVYKQLFVQTYGIIKIH